jgi:glycosyltransferase involved in cell wall biosynthesis
MEHKTKLLLVADTYYPKVDGTLKFMEEFLKRTKDDFYISLLVPNYKHHKDTKTKTFCKTSRFFSLSGYPSIRNSFSNLRKITKSIKENEIIFIQGPALLSFYALFFGRFYNKFVITYIHVITWELLDNFIKLPKNIRKIIINISKKVAIWLYNKADIVLVPYHDLKDSLKEGGITSNITVAKLGVDINRFNIPKNKDTAKNKIGIAPSKTVIGYVGRVSQEKNVHTLLSAFQSIKNRKNLHLLIVGDGTKEIVKEIKQKKNVTLTGFVDNVEDYLKAMDIFVMPSLTETTSLATLEAMSTGLPVIATKVGFIKKYIIKDYNGVFFPRESPSHLTLKIKLLLEDIALREKLGENARKTIAYSFSWERSINKIKRILLRDE